MTPGLEDDRERPTSMTRWHHEAADEGVPTPRRSLISPPNHGVQPTANRIRACIAPAIGGA
jgi:hypothetical protein